MSNYLQDCSVLVAYPCHDMLHADFCHDLSMLLLKSAVVFRIHVGSSQHRGSIICISRNSIVEQALQISGITHILWLDSDMRFPADTLARLLSHQAPVVGCTYTMRLAPHAATHRNLDGSSSLTESMGTYAVHSLGMGCVLTDVAVFHDLAKLEPNNPYFKVEYDEKRRPCGEDIYFYKRLHRANIPTLLDVELSRHIEHVGLKSYGVNDIKKVFDGTERDYQFVTELRRHEL